MKIYCCRNCMEKNRSKIKSDKDYFNSLLKYKTFEAEKEYFVGFGLENKVKDCKCIFCNSPVELLNIEDGELAKISHFGSPNPDYVLAMNKLKGDDIIAFTSKYNELIEIQNQRKAMNLAKQQSEQRESNTRHCPKCNGTNFTPVRKKYGLFLGFATNKVELVCNNCGYRMKAEN